MAQAPDTIPALLDVVAARFPDRPALIWDGATTAYGQVVLESRSVAQGLRELGFGPGDRIGFWCPNIPAYPVFLLACARLGVAAVAVNTRFGAGEVEGLLRRTRAKALLYSPEFDPETTTRVLGAIDPAHLPHLRYRFIAGSEAVDPPGWDAVAQVPLEDLAGSTSLGDSTVGPDSQAATFTTSGTTSAPKIVLHHHHSIVHHARDCAHAFGFGPETVSLAVLPFCGVFGFAQMMAVLAAGGTLVLVPHFEAGKTAALVRRHKVTSFFATDDMVHRMLGAVSDPVAFPSVQFAGYAAFNSALADLPDRAQARGLTLTGLYGMSECMALFAMRHPEGLLEDRRRAGGRPVSAEARIRVRDPNSGALLGTGQAGALEVAGPSLFHAYDGNLAATEAAFTEDGFFRTGDLAVLEPDGCFEFLGRMGDVLRLGGFLVNPAEIEDHLQAHPSVAAAQVVAASTQQATRPVAFVVLAKGQRLDESALLAHCEALAVYKRPVRFIALEAFPVTESANGMKIQRARLRDLAQEALRDALA